MQIVLTTALILVFFRETFLVYSFIVIFPDSFLWLYNTDL